MSISTPEFLQQALILGLTPGSVGPGSNAFKFVQQTSNFTVQPTDSNTIFIVRPGTAAQITVTLLSSASYPANFVFGVAQDYNSSTQEVLITPNAADTINFNKVLGLGRSQGVLLALDGNNNWTNVSSTSGGPSLPIVVDAGHTYTLQAKDNAAFVFTPTDTTARTVTLPNNAALDVESFWAVIQNPSTTPATIASSDTIEGPTSIPANSAAIIYKRVYGSPNTWTVLIFGGSAASGNFGFSAIKNISALSYTATVADLGTLLVFSNNGGPSLTIPAGLGTAPKGFGVLCTGAKNMTLVASGITLIGSATILPNVLTFLNEYATNVYQVSGFRSNFVTNNGVATINIGTDTSYSIVEPVAAVYQMIDAANTYDIFLQQMDISTLVPGDQILIYNLTSFNATLKFSTGDLATVIQPFKYVKVYITDVSTPRGSADVFLYGTAASANLTDGTQPTVASMKGLSLAGNFPMFADTFGTIQNSGLDKNNFQINNGFSSLSLASGNIVLTNPFPAELEFEGQVDDSATVTLPDMTPSSFSYARGQVLTWVNGSSTNILTILNFSGTPIVTLQPLAYARVIVAATNTADGVFVVGVLGTASSKQVEDFAPAALSSVLLTSFSTPLSLAHQGKILIAAVGDAVAAVADSNGIASYPDGFSFELTGILPGDAGAAFIPKAGETVSGLAELFVPMQGSVTIYKDASIGPTDWQIASKNLYQNYPIIFSSAVNVPVDLRWNGNTLISEGAIGFTLPSIGAGAGQAPWGTNFTFINLSSSILAIDTDGSDTFQDGSTTVNLNIGQSITVNTNGITGAWFFVANYIPSNPLKVIETFTSGYSTNSTDLAKRKINNESTAATINILPNLTMPVKAGWYTVVTCQNSAGLTLVFDGGDTVFGGTTLGYGVTAEITKCFSTLPSGASVWQIDQTSVPPATTFTLSTLIPDTSNITNDWQIGDFFTLAGGAYIIQAQGQVDSVHIATYNIGGSPTTYSVGDFITFTAPGIGGTQPVAYVSSVSFGVPVTISFDGVAHPGATHGDMTGVDAATVFTQDTTTGVGTGIELTSPTYGIQSTSITIAGTYTSIPSNPVVQDTTSGSGFGAQFNATWT